MTTEQAFSSPSKHNRPGRAADTDPALLPSRRVVEPPLPGTDEAEFLANLNEVYGAEDPEDDQILEGIRRTMRAVLERTP
ncbi:MAG TPA: hypothetical protein VNL35_19155 [Chloroflexota bacterium]|nr:hypothetical protein [Chloroflexota bacterium]